MWFQLDQDVFFGGSSIPQFYTHNHKYGFNHKCVYCNVLPAFCFMAVGHRNNQLDLTRIVLLDLDKTEEIKLVQLYTNTVMNMDKQ